jgi:hypothetical protein
MGWQVGKSGACYFPVPGERVAALTVDGLPPVVDDHRAHPHVGGQHELGIELLLLQVLVHAVPGGVHRLGSGGGEAAGE